MPATNNFDTPQKQHLRVVFVPPSTDFLLLVVGLLRVHRECHMVKLSSREYLSWASPPERRRHSILFLDYPHQHRILSKHKIIVNIKNFLMIYSNLYEEPRCATLNYECYQIFCRNIRRRWVNSHPFLHLWIVLLLQLNLYLITDLIK